MSTVSKKTFSFAKEAERLARLNLSDLRRYLAIPEDEAFVIHPFTREFRGVIVTIQKHSIKIIIDTFLGIMFAQQGIKVILQRMPDTLVMNINAIYQDGFRVLSQDNFVTITGGKL